MEATTWYRDSHGLFDYEEHEKITKSHLKSRSSFLLKRDGDLLNLEEFTDFESMVENEKALADLN